ncbi:peptidylprolyl isomerase [Brevibacillus fluminis]|uniref:Peptidyl-prolyl cis-trans isomerase n=1 Tax=Brevibacillus fluminis TaxID=511487 RepID=A0A3M8DU57_9BACL|nr:peptidylprolyl isomerase [Brevibacillus fluminis]RNB91708.1 peptidylprolyl isomerase [Brevibacillus fluminis]
MKRFILTLGTMVLSLALLAGCSSTAAPDANDPANTAGGQQQQQPTPPLKHDVPKGKYTKYPDMVINKDKKYTATVTTSLGDFQIELFAKDAPKTVNNFVFLAKDHFFDGITFHRVIKDFMVQTGDPQGTGMGGPGYQFEDELNNGHAYEEGVVAMANAGPNTNGSQFFIGSGPDVKNLKHDPAYTIFGKVIKGQDIITKIASVPVKANPITGQKETPVTPPVIKSIKIEEK